MPSAFGSDTKINRKNVSWLLGRMNATASKTEMCAREMVETKTECKMLDVQSPEKKYKHKKWNGKATH